MWPLFGRATHFSTLLFVILCLFLPPAPVNSRVIKKQVVKIKRSHHYFSFMSLSVNDACKEMASYADSLQPAASPSVPATPPGRSVSLPPWTRLCCQDRILPYLSLTLSLSFTIISRVNCRWSFK